MGQSSAGRKGNKLFNKNHHLIFLTEMIFVQLPARSWPVCPCQYPQSGSQASPCQSLGLPVLVRSQILISAASCLFLLLPSPLQLLAERSRSLAVSRMQVGATADSHPQWSKSPICVEETSPKMGKNTKSGPLCPVTTDFYATLKLPPIETPCPGSSHQPLPKPKASPLTNVSVTPLLLSPRCTSPNLLHPNPTSKVQHLPSPGPHDSLLLPPSHSSLCQAGHPRSTEPLYTPCTQPPSFSWWPGM